MSQHSSKTAGEAGILRWRNWLPGLLLATLGGIALLALAGHWGTFGFSFVLAVPFAIGCILGYALRARLVVLTVIAVVMLAALLIVGIASGTSNLLCALVAGAILLGPLIVGTMIGWALHSALKFKQRHLPMLFLLPPVALMAVEHRAPPQLPIETVQTTKVLSLSAERAWSNLVFYEEVPHDPPWLARLGLPRPLGTEGEAQRVGGIKTCRYERGYLRKRLTRVNAPAFLGFEVIEQVGIEEHSLRLLDGSFEFESLSYDPPLTRVTLTTRYAPLLAARPFWRPFEHYLTRALHEHVIQGIELRAQRHPP